METFRKHNAKRQSTEEYRTWAKQYRSDIATPKLTRKRRDDPKANIDHRMGQLIRAGLKRGKGGRAWKSMVGYSIEELMRHLERQFTKGMSWENMGGWHIDHILPKSGFSFSSPEDSDFKACYALSNLRPLWSLDNIRKNAKRLLLV